MGAQSDGVDGRTADFCCDPNGQENTPAMHCDRSVAAVTAVDVPVGHATQSEADIAPVRLRYVERGHGVHAGDAGAEAK